MVQLYEEMRSKFSVDEFSHYLFTPRDLTSWVRGLLRYDFKGGKNEASSEPLLEVFAHEALRLFRDRLVGQDARNKFDNILVSVIRAEWSANVFEGLDGKNYYLNIFQF